MQEKEFKNKLINTLKTARGQLDAVLVMTEEEKYCTEVLTQLLAVQGLVRKSINILLENQIKNCLKDAVENMDKRENKIDEIVSILSKFSKS